MAENPTDAVLKDLADRIREMNQNTMFPRTTDERSIDALAKKMDDLEKGNIQSTKEMIKAYNAAMKKYGVKKEIKSLKDVLGAEDQKKAQQSILSSIEQNTNAQGKMVFDNIDKFNTVWDSLNRDAESAGGTLEDLGLKTTKFYNKNIKAWEIRIQDHTDSVKKLISRTDRLSKATDEGANATKRFNKSVDLASGVLGKLGGAAKKIGIDFARLAEQEQRFAQQNAVADAGWIDGLKRMQISTIDYMKILKDTRIESLAMGAAGRDFKDSLEEGQSSLRKFTANSTEAANVSAAFHKNVSRMGVAQKDLEGAVTQQTDIYKKHYRVLGYSADEFSKLTEELINDQGMRSTLLNLQEKERKQYVMGIQQRMAEYQTMGYTIERAKELQKTFQSLNAMNPKERMKQAAKTRAMMGAMGMGAQGEELFNLQTKYRTMSADQKLDADKRMAQIQGEAASKFGQVSGAGAGIGQAMSFQMMADKTGFTQIANTFETASGEGLKLTKEQLEAAKISAAKNNEISSTASDLLLVQDTWRAASTTALTSIATNMLSGFSELAKINTAGFIASTAASKGLGKIFKGGGRAAKGAGVLGLGVAAFEIGSLIGDKITAVLKEDTESYAKFADTVGGTWNTFLASWGNEEAQKTLDRNAEAKMAIAQMKIQQELAEKQNATLADIKKTLDKGNDVAKEQKDSIDGQTKENKKTNQMNKNNPARAAS